MTCKLMLGDCFDFFRKGITKKITHCITSPPYNRKRNDKYEYFNDNTTNYYIFLQKLTDDILPIVDKYIFLNIMTNFYNRQDVYRYIGNNADIIKDIIIWSKANPLPNGQQSLCNAYEFILIISKHNIKANSNYVKNIITTPVNSYHIKGHHAIMQKTVCDFIIDNFTKKGDSIIDPFAGTGTTGISALERDRNFLGIEINPHYFDICKKRLGNIQTLLL